MTNGYLTQKDLRDDDFLSIKYQDFERLFIFDRKPCEAVTDPEENFSKRLFMRLLHLVMTIAVESDEDSRGRLGIIKAVKRPE